MPTIISGLRIARSFVSPDGVAEVTREIDFQLGPEQGIQIHAVLGYGHIFDDSPAVSDTVPTQNRGHQSLHLEAGTLENVPVGEGDDADDIDTDIFYAQVWGSLILVGTTNTFGAAASVTVTPSGLVTFPKPILAARNITHQGETFGTGSDLKAGVLIYYEYVKFSLAELGFLLARRG